MLINLSIWISAIFLVRLMTMRLSAEGSTTVSIALSVAICWPCILYFVNDKFRTSLKMLLANKRLFLFLLFYSFAGLISSLNGLHPIISLGYVINLLIGLVLIYSYNVSIDDSTLQKSFLVYSFIGALSLVLYAEFSSIGHQNRLQGLLNPNQIGIICASVIMTSLLARKWWVILIATIPASYVMYLTNSRTSILALILGVIIWILLYQKKLPNCSTLSLIFFIATILALFVYYYKQEILEYIIKTFALNDEYRGLKSKGTGRLDAWKEAWAIFKSSPLLGVGPNMHENLMKSYSSSHNGYIAVLADSGILGGIPVIYLTIASIYNYIKEKKDIFLAWSLGIISMCLFISIFEKAFLSVGNPTSLIFMILLVRSFIFDSKHLSEKMSA